MDLLFCVYVLVLGCVLKLLCLTNDGCINYGDWNIWVWWSCVRRMMDEWILDVWNIWVLLVIQSCLKNKIRNKFKEIFEYELFEKQNME